ncbi:MAG TPA: tetratricopeptide repeat protein, partial [Vulgatibacter sp.]
MNDDRLERGNGAAGPLDAAPGKPPSNVSIAHLAPASVNQPFTATPNLAVEVTIGIDGPDPREDAAERIASLEREVLAAGDVPASARLHHELGRLWETRLSNPRNAAIAYQNAFRADPRHLPTLQSGRRLFARLGNWSIVVQFLEAEAEAVPDGPTKAGLLYERGVVLEERLARRVEARTCFERALELDPANLPLLAHLESVYAGDPAAVAAVRIRWAEAVSDPDAAAQALASAALLLEGVPDPARQPVDLLREAFERSPDDPAIRARLCAHLERAGEREELIAVLGAELRAVVAPADAAAVWYRIAKLHLAAGREDDAVAALLSALRLAPDEPLIAGELARLFELREAWEQLAEVLETRASLATDGAERAALLVELAALLDNRMDRPDRAMEHYLAALRLAPGDPVALASLGKLQHQQGDWAGLLRTFETEALYARDPRQKAARTFKAAAILEEKLGRVEEAIARYGAALQLFPGYLPAQKALVRLYSREGRHAELVATLEQDLASLQDREQIVALLSQIADVQEKKLLDRAAALRTHGRILEVSPGHLPTIRHMARIAEESRDWEALVRVLEAEAAHTGDQRQVVLLLHRIAEVLEEEIGDKKRAVEALRRVLALSPSYLPALRALGRIYAQRGMWAELLEMHRREAEIAPTASAAASLVYRVAELYEQKLCMEEKAIEAYREVLSLAPSHLPALRSLARIHRSQGAWQSLVDVLLQEAGTRTDPRERAAALCQVAELREERLGQRPEAKEAYAEVLRLAPGHMPALRALDRLHSMDSEWEDVARVLERMAAIGEPSIRLAAVSRLAGLSLEIFGDADRALRWCEAGLDLAPRDLCLLRVLERARGDQDPARRADVRERIARAVDDGRLAASLLIQVATDRERAGSEEGASHALQLAIDADPRSEPAREMLDAALNPEREPARLAVVLERRVSACEDPELRAALLVRLAELREDHLGDPEGALVASREALRLAPGHLGALTAACRAAEALSDPSTLAELLVVRAASERDAGNSAASLVEAGRLFESLQEPERALALYHQALERAPTERAAIERVEAILGARGDAESIARIYEERAAREADPGAAADALVAAARLRQDP